MNTVHYMFIFIHIYYFDCTKLESPYTIRFCVTILALPGTLFTKNLHVCGVHSGKQETIKLFPRVGITAGGAPGTFQCISCG